MTHAIEVSALTKTYGEHQVLKGIDLHVRKGEIFALLGVNGAGKTTALECIEGLKKYNSGSITVIGRTGIQLQSSSLPEHSRSFFADSSYMLSFSVLCSCVCSRLISPSVSSWHKQDNTLMHQSPGHIQRRTPYNF